MSLSDFDASILPDGTVTLCQDDASGYSTLTPDEADQLSIDLHNLANRGRLLQANQGRLFDVPTVH